MAHDTRPHLLTHHQAHHRSSRLGRRAQAREMVYDESATPGATAGAHDRPEVSGATQAITGWQHRAGCNDRGSGRQLVSTSTTAGGEDGATGAGPHAQPKPVLLGASAIVRLEGPLTHGMAPSIQQTVIGWASGPDSRARQTAGAPTGSINGTEPVGGPSNQTAPGGAVAMPIASPSASRGPTRPAPIVTDRGALLPCGAVLATVGGHRRPAPITSARPVYAQAVDKIVDTIAQFYGSTGVLCVRDRGGTPAQRETVS
jgi:hypothetical protein